tara:strand:+ start:7976 stop:8452 length:477 start_codon:yes stop_codon:yes gene_type:complete
MRQTHQQGGAMKTEPKNGGSVPLRTSKNPVVGVVVCQSCGGACSVHQSKGKRAALLYTICDNCGTDQRTGAPIQEYWRSTMQPTLEALEENAPAKPEVKPEKAEPEQPTEAAPIAAQTENEPAPEIKPEPEPKQTEKGKPITAIIFGLVFGGICGAAA